MLSKRGFDRLAGVLFISIFVTFAVGIVLGEPGVDWERDKVEESLREVIDDQEIRVTGGAFLLAGAFALMAAAGPLYLLFRPHGRPLALFGLVGLLGSGVFIAISMAVNFALMLLARDFVDGVVAFPDAQDALVSTARTLSFLGNAVPFAAALTLLGLGILPTGILIVQSRAAPLWLGWWAVVSGAVLLLTFAIASEVDAVFIIAAVGGISALFFFLFLGIWLLRWGSREAAPA